MTEAATIKAYCRFSGYTDSADVIAERLGIQPTTSWRQGDTVPGTCLKRVNNAIVVHSSLDGRHDVVDHVGDVVTQISHVNVKELDIVNGITVTLVIVIYTPASIRPSIAINRESIRFLAALDASVDIDYYSL